MTWNKSTTLSRFIAIAFASVIMIGCSGASKSAYRQTGEPEQLEIESVNELIRTSATDIPDEIEDFNVDGIRVILRSTGSSFHTIVTKLFIRGGLPALPDGVSPAAEQLALDIPRFSGPASIGRSAFLRERDRMNLGLGATAERDFSTLTLRCADENFDRAWEIFAGMITDPGYDPVTVKNVKERAITGIRNRRVVPESYAGYLADSIFFYGHPYSRVAEVGDVQGLDVDQIRAYHRKLFVKSRLYMVVVGNVSRDEIERKIKTTLGTLPKGKYEPPTVPIPEMSKHPTVKITSPWGRDSIPTNYLVVRHLGPGYGKKGFYAMERLRSFIGGFLFRKIRIDRNLSYAPDASTYDHTIGFGDISISTDYPDSAWKVTRDEIIDFFRTHLIGEQYLSQVPTTWYTSQYLDMQTAESQATQLGRAYYYTGDWREAFESLEHYLKVTPEELHDVAMKYLKNFTVVIVGDPDSITRSEYLPEDVRDEGSGVEETGAR
jgi:zinc protease